MKVKPDGKASARSELVKGKSRERVRTLGEKRQ